MEDGNGADSLNEEFPMFDWNDKRVVSDDVRYTWRLVTRKGILHDETDSAIVKMLKSVDGDDSFAWTVLRRGGYTELNKEFDKIAKAVRADAGGIGYDGFERAYPHSEWEQLDWFDTPVGLDYSLWKSRARMPNAPGVTICCWTDDDGTFNWKREHDGAFVEVQKGFEDLKAQHRPPPPPPSPYVALANFGRF